MSKYSHVDKGLDLLVEINAIDKWSYQHGTNTYTVYGKLRSSTINYQTVPGINHKIYDADKLAKMNAGELNAQMIMDFNVMKDDKTKVGNIEKKLNKLINLIESQKAFKTIDAVNVQDMLIKLFRDKKLPRKDLEFANELWRKYNK